jgi:catalase
MTRQRKTGFTTIAGTGGETHQSGGQADRDSVLTTNHGVPVSDNQNSLSAGARGPTLLEDFVLREKIFHFDHERIPERIVHARGSGAHGEFECIDAIPDLTRASLFQEKGHKVPVFARFSTVAGGAGSEDTPRDVRGFAVKFYTEQGNWDLVGNNIPVFFIQDAIKFPDLVHSVKMESDRGYPQAASAHDTFWDFVSLMPETMHMIMWAMSDRGIPRSLRMIEGFGVHTFRMVNANGKSHFVKFHWKPELGLQSTTWDEARKIAGADPDFHRRDLYEAIESGDFPVWKLGIQVFDEAWAAKQPYDVLDATKLIPEEDIPVRFIGKMTLNRNPDNFFAETEQSAFLPSNVVPGIDFTNDPLLQGRLFSYLDTQKSRLGTTNFHQIPINAPKCPMHNFQRDGMMQTQVPQGRANYEPNSLAEVGEFGGPRESPDIGFSTFQANNERNDGDSKLRVRSELFADHYSQARLFYRSQQPEEQKHLTDAMVFELSKLTLEHVVNRILSRIQNIDADLANKVAEGLGMSLPEKLPAAREPVDMKPSPALSIVLNAKRTLKGRKVGILFDEGSNDAEIKLMQDRVEKAGGKTMLIAPKIGNLKVKNGTLKAEGQLKGTPSAVLDAVVTILSPDAAKKLCDNPDAVSFVRDAYLHLKAIGHCGGSVVLLEKAGIPTDEGITELDDSFITAAAKRFYAREM